MKEFKSISIKSLSFTPRKMGDLLYYDGPLLSHFQDISKPNEHYFYRWVDNDHEVNRWLIFKNTDIEVLQFLEKTLTERDLIEKNPFVTLLDLDDNINTKGIYLLSLEDLPHSYLPSSKSFFDQYIYEPYAVKLKYKLKAAQQKKALTSMHTTITFNELQKIKDSLPEGSMHIIAQTLNLSEEMVRNYFGGTHCHFEQGPNGGIVYLEDSTILDRALEILATAYTEQNM